MKCWVVTSGAYEEYGIDGIAATLPAAIDLIGSRYQHPYRVRWEWPKLEGEEWRVRGHFDHVPGYSTQHYNDFYIRLWDIHGSI